MAFMQPAIYFGTYYEVSANHGETYIVPADVSGVVKTYGDLADYVEGKVDEPDTIAEVKRGWLARMSAPGYMDCTDWSAHDTQQEAENYLNEYYGDDDSENGDTE